jgi:hypothetical protein
VNVTAASTGLASEFFRYIQNSGSCYLGLMFQNLLESIMRPRQHRSCRFRFDFSLYFGNHVGSLESRQKNQMTPWISAASLGLTYLANRNLLKSLPVLYHIIQLCPENPLLNLGSPG